MPTDRYNRTIHYLRVSVTDKCNYRCTYCMPAEGIPLKPHKAMLRYESIALIAGVAGALGFNQIRLTGGEPLVKKNIESLVEMIRLTGKYREITMTTNGSLLTPEKARHLKQNGLSRINISLDTLDPKRFAEITRGGAVRDVLKGIDAAKSAELDPVKINMVVFAETTEEEISAMKSFCANHGLVLQTIKHFSLYNREHVLPAPRDFDRPLPCTRCNRLRLTADGYLKPCLFSNQEIKVDLNNIETSISHAIAARPEFGTACVNRGMHQVGG
ncbi:MAG: radical SAM protein [Chitinivibrionales bacterium]|nr:radical SAM protein [Chitinivibrionales bacterium]